LILRDATAVIAPEDQPKALPRQGPAAVTTFR
jgi:hypothetical protein